MGLFDNLVASGALDQVDIYAQGKISSLTNSEVLDCIKDSSVRNSIFGNSACSSRALIRELEAEAKKRGISKYLSY